jgi:plastocyanin
MINKSKIDWIARSVMAFAVALLAFAAAAAAETVTLPVAASATGQGGVPFVSDVRVFNTSYTDPLNVTAVYRFNGATQVFQLAPREARGFDDICVSLFATPQSLGAVEFTFNGSDDELVVTSQLRSPSPGGGHVGMFVPGLPSSAASAVSVLTSLVNGDSRTNVGVYNPNGTGVTATIRLYDGNVLLGTSAVQLAAHAVTQVNNIYGTAGFGSLAKTDGYATVVSSGGPLFTYAAEADNVTGDLILIVGAADQTAPAGFNAPTATPTGGVPAPTPTPTPPAGSIHVVNIGQTGISFTDTVSGTNQTTIHVGDTVQWVWMGSPHSTTSGTCTGGGPGYAAKSCDADGKWESGIHSPPTTFSQTFHTAGTFKYFCDVHLDSMVGTVTVNP